MMTKQIKWLALFLFVIGGEAQIRGRRCRTDNGDQGTCIPIRDCQPLRQLLALVRGWADPPGATGILRRSICLFQNNEPLVCCPDFSGLSNPPPVENPATVSNRTDQCGISGLTDRIINGAPAPLKAWPWMVVLKGNKDARSFWFCGGTLISDRYVLTAAHCFKEQLGVNLEFARVGEHDLGSSSDCEFSQCAPPVQDIPVEAIIRHPSYGSPCNECNDIALLRLARKATLHTLYVTPICLPQNPQRDMGFSVEEFQGKAAWAAGWGTTVGVRTVTQQPRILQQVQLPIRELDYCAFQKKIYPDPDMVLCAGGEGKDTCRGDSGGPLTLTNRVGTRYFLVGVTSVGPTLCGASNTQGLYTSVNHYVDWITRTMRT